jgi:short-subunit dehydrogenase
MINHNLPKVILVTGASSGIGRAVVLQLSVQHARIALVARRKHLLEEIAKEVTRLGGEALIIPADVADRSQIEGAIDTVEQHWKRLDVLINNAGSGVFGSIEECNPEDFEKQIKVNYLAAVYAIKAALPLMRRQGSGTIINVSSISGKATSPFDAPYCASKFALSAFTSVLRMELSGTKISVNLICPGYTKTEWERAVVQRRTLITRTPLQPMTPDRVAREIVACIRRPKHEVIIPKILILPVVVHALLPGFYEWWQSRFRMPETGRNARDKREQ